MARAWAMAVMRARICAALALEALELTVADPDCDEAVFL